MRIADVGIGDHVLLVIIEGQVHGSRGQDPMEMILDRFKIFDEPDILCDGFGNEDPELIQNYFLFAGSLRCDAQTIVP